MASSAFVKALDKKRNGENLLKKARDAEQQDFSPPEIPDDNYVARIRAKVGVTPNKNVPYAEFRWTISDDSGFYGKGYRQTFYLEDEDAEREEKNFEFLGKTLKVLTGNNELELESFDQIEELVKDIDAANPYCKITVKSGMGKKNKWMSAYFNERVEVASDEPTPDNTQSETIIQKGDLVIYDGNEYEVMVSSPRAKTATIRSVDTDEKTSNIPWNQLEITS
jgi:hypothetical protein